MPERSHPVPIPLRQRIADFRYTGLAPTVTAVAALAVVLLIGARVRRIEYVPYAGSSPSLVQRSFPATPQSPAPLPIGFVLQDDPFDGDPGRVSGGPDSWPRPVSSIRGLGELDAAHPDGEALRRPGRAPYCGPEGPAGELDLILVVAPPEPSEAFGSSLVADYGSPTAPGPNEPLESGTR